LKDAVFAEAEIRQKRAKTHRRGIFSSENFSCQKYKFLTCQTVVLSIDWRSQFDSLGEMASHGLRDQDRLEGASNYVIWKTKILVVLEEYDIEAYVKSVLAVPANNDQKKYKAEQGKAKRCILDGVRDHVVHTCRAKIQPTRCGKLCLHCIKALPNNGRCT